MNVEDIWLNSIKIEKKDSQNSKNFYLKIISVKFIYLI